MGWPSFPSPGRDDWDADEDPGQGDWPDDEAWAEGTAFDPDQGQPDDDADDQPTPPTAPLAQPGATNIPYPTSPAQRRRRARRAQQWPSADAAPWNPDPDRWEEDVARHTASWPLPPPRPIAEPEP